MKTLNNFITEKLIINKNIKNQNSIIITHTYWAYMWDLFSMFSIEYQFSEFFKDETNHDGDLYWMSIKHDLFKDERHTFLFKISNNIEDVKWKNQKDMTSHLEDHFGPIKNIILYSILDYFDKCVFGIYILTNKEIIQYYVSPNKQDLEKLWDILLTEGWKPYKELNIYDLYK